jgi:hypothetical protein
MSQLPGILSGSITRYHSHLLSGIWVAGEHKQKETCNGCPTDHKRSKCTETCIVTTKACADPAKKKAFQPVIAGWSLPPAPPAQ